MKDLLHNMLYNVIPVKFYRYPHVVLSRLAVIDDYHSNKCVLDFETKLYDLFHRYGINAVSGTIAVFECHCNGVPIFFGFSETVFSIGFNITQMELHIWKWNSRKEVICEKESDKQLLAISQLKIRPNDNYNDIKRIGLYTVCPICLGKFMEARKKQSVI